MSKRFIRIRRGGMAGAAGVLGALAIAAPAHAACSTDGMSQVFSAWGDTAQYRAVDGGSFEDGAPGWTLAGGAKVVTDHSNWNISGSNQHSLELPSGSSAVTPPICVAQGSPTARLFAYTAKRVAASGSTLQVEVLYTSNTRGGQASKVLGTAPDELAWDAARKMSLAQGQLGLMPDSSGNTYIRYRFTPLYGTTWRIDDVFVDPRLKY
jgi:hypothetical protein